MIIQEFKTHIEEELRNKLRGNNESTPILNRLEKHLKDFDEYSLTDLLNPKNMKHDLYVSFLFQICFPSRIKMDIDAEYAPIKKKRIAIVSCKSKKQDYICSADEMYSKSTAYKAQKDFFIKAYDDYYIFSSKYGIIHYSQIIEPYDSAINLIGQSKRAHSLEIKTLNENFIKLVNSQFKYLISKGYIIDLHASKAYYDYLSDDIKSKINYVKQPKGTGQVSVKYNQIYDMLDTHSLEECLKFISYINPNKPKEIDKWFYHNEYDPFFGTSMKLISHCKKNNITPPNGNIINLVNGDIIHTIGWVLDESLLPYLSKNENDRWKMDKKKLKELKEENK